MLVMDGFEMVKYIREEMKDLVVSLFILVMMVYVYILEGQKYKEFGMNDYLFKFFDFQ